MDFAICKTYTRSLFQHVLNVLFPSFCLHCATEVKKGYPLLCKDCLYHLELVSAKNRCRYCFEENINCPVCIKKRSKEILHAASCFDAVGPGQILFKEFLKTARPSLAKDLAALFIIQWAHLNWPIPDVILFLPKSHSLRLMSKEIGGFFKRPVYNLIQLSWLQPGRFVLKNLKYLTERRVLLISDKLSPFSLKEGDLYQAGRALKEGFVKSVYLLTGYLSTLTKPSL